MHFNSCQVLGIFRSSCLVSFSFGFILGGLIEGSNRPEKNIVVVVPEGKIVVGKIDKKVGVFYFRKDGEVESSIILHGEGGISKFQLKKWFLVKADNEMVVMGIGRGNKKKIILGVNGDEATLKMFKDMRGDRNGVPQIMLECKNKDSWLYLNGENYNCLIGTRNDFNSGLEMWSTNGEVFKVLTAPEEACLALRSPRIGRQVFGLDQTKCGYVLYGKENDLKFAIGRTKKGKNVFIKRE